MNEQQIFVVVEESDWPYMDGPFGRDATVLAFTEKEAAQEYGEKLVEERVVTRDQIKIMSMKMEGLLELVEELTVFAREEYGSGFEILLQEPEQVTTIYDSTQAINRN